MSKKIKEKHTNGHKDLARFGQSTYVHKGDEQFTINMKVPKETISINSLRIHGRFTK